MARLCSKANARHRPPDTAGCQSLLRAAKEQAARGAHHSRELADRVHRLVRAHSGNSLARPFQMVAQQQQQEGGGGGNKARSASVSGHAKPRSSDGNRTTVKGQEMTMPPTGSSVVAEKLSPRLVPAAEAQSSSQQEPSPPSAQGQSLRAVSQSSLQSPGSALSGVGPRSQWQQLRQSAAPARQEHAASAAPSAPPRLGGIVVKVGASAVVAAAGTRERAPNGLVAARRPAMSQRDEHAAAAVAARTRSAQSASRVGATPTAAAAGPQSRKHGVGGAAASEDDVARSQRRRPAEADNASPSSGALQAQRQPQRAASASVTAVSTSRAAPTPSKGGSSSRSSREDWHLFAPTSAVLPRSSVDEQLFKRAEPVNRQSFGSENRHHRINTNTNSGSLSRKDKLLHPIAKVAHKAASAVAVKENSLDRIIKSAAPHPHRHFLSTETNKQSARPAAKQFATIKSSLSTSANLTVNRSKLNNSKMADQAVIDKLEAGFAKLQAATPEQCHSLLKKYLTREVLDKNKAKKTAMGATLLDVVQSGFENLDSGVGIYAPDAESYTLFADLFNPVIEDYHGGFKPTDKHPQSDFGDMNTLVNLDPNNEFVISTRVRCGRSLQGYPFNPCLTEAQYKEMEQKVSTTLKEVGGDLAGTYYPLTGMTKETQQQLIDDHFLFKEGDRFLQAANACRYWPTGRGIFHNAEKTFLVWVNEEDHLRIISMQKGGDLKTIYDRLIRGAKAIEAKVPFSRDDRLGFLTFCPTNLGTTIRASVHIKLPKLAADRKKLEEVASRYNLQVRGTSGEHTESVGGVYDISNKRRLGLTEYQAVREMQDGILELIKIEKSL